MASGKHGLAPAAIDECRSLGDTTGIDNPATGGGAAESALARISHSLDAPWLDLWLATASSSLANTSSIGGGPKKRRQAKPLRQHRGILCEMRAGRQPVS
jgi:hypothetical protein